MALVNKYEVTIECIKGVLVVTDTLGAVLKDPEYCIENGQVTFSSCKKTVIATDSNTPNIDGFEAIKNLLKECCETPTTVVLEDDIITLKEGFTTEVWCKDGTECQLTKCIVKNEDNTYTTEYLEGSTVVSLSDYEKCEIEVDKPTYIETCEYNVQSEIDAGILGKNLTKISIQQWCLTTGEFVFIESGKPLEVNNYLTITEFKKMSNIQGIVMPENLAAKTTSACLTFCVDAAVSLDTAAILALFVADGVLLPDGTAPTGLLNYTVTTVYAGQQAKDATGAKKKLKAGFCIESNGDIVNAGSTHCPPAAVLVDEDCDGFLLGEDLTIENTGTEAGAVRVCAVFIPLDADDADETVQ